MILQLLTWVELTGQISSIFKEEKFVISLNGMEAKTALFIHWLG